MYCRRLVCRKIVHDQEVVGSDFLGKRVADVNFEAQRVHAAIDHQRGNHALRPPIPHKSGGGPMTMGFVNSQAFALGSITTGGVYVGGVSGFI